MTPNPFVFPIIHHICTITPVASVTGEEENVSQQRKYIKHPSEESCHFLRA